MRPSSLRQEICIVLKAYYDSGGKIDSIANDFVTLAGVAGKFWKRFERDWKAVLRKHGALYLHTTDAMATPPQGIFEGWSEARVTSFISDCVDVIETFSGSETIALQSATVPLADYKRCVSQGVHLPIVEHLCGSFCIAHAMFSYDNAVLKDGSGLFFDWDDPFFGHAVNLWREKSLRRTPLWRSVNFITPARSEELCELQAADLIAWSVNSVYRGYPLRVWQQTLLLLPRSKEYFDYDLLVKISRNRRIEDYDTLRLPQRRPFR